MMNTYLKNVKDGIDRNLDRCGLDNQVQFLEKIVEHCQYRLRYILDGEPYVRGAKKTRHGAGQRPSKMDVPEIYGELIERIMEYQETHDGFFPESLAVTQEQLDTFIDWTKKVSENMPEINTFLGVQLTVLSDVSDAKLFSWQTWHSVYFRKLSDIGK